MCELLGMSTRHPTDINFSLGEFARHGGETGPHRDGWGIAYAMHRDFRVIKEPLAAADSDCVRYIEAHAFASRLVLSHIRRATRPKVLTYENTHPFERELFGRRFVFAHNGDMPGVERLLDASGERFLPLGFTDSEQAFCTILNRLAARVPRAADYRAEHLVAVLREISPELLALGKCNFLLSDGEHLFAHGDHSLYSVTRHCGSEEHHVLRSDELRMDMAHPGTQQAALVATVPLTDAEDWQRFARGELRVFRDGELIGRYPPAAAA